ncbi:MAG: hypothetical protein QGG73_07340 [Candidatus Hydrogenedentes bacterium]|nr:hypothetical protein [Candidatus Hydrogenedentota bacterium]
MRRIYLFRPHALVSFLVVFIDLAVILEPLRAVDEEVPYAKGEPSITSVIGHVYTLSLGCSSLLYGICRGLSFHPVYDSAYATPTEHMPWHPGKPFLKAPPHIVRQDILALTVMTGLAFFLAGTRWFLVPWLFATFYALFLIATFFRARLKLISFALLTVTSFPLASPGEPVLCVTVTIVTLGISLVGLRQSFGLRGCSSERSLDFTRSDFEILPIPKPWPLDRLSDPKQGTPSFGAKAFLATYPPFVLMLSPNGLDQDSSAWDLIGAAVVVWAIAMSVRITRYRTEVDPESWTVR